MQDSINREGQRQHTPTVEALLDRFADELRAGDVDADRHDETINTIAEHMLNERSATTLDGAAANLIRWPV